MSTTNQQVYDSFHELFTTSHDKAGFDINVAEIATVTKYDKKKHIASVQPLIDDADGRDDARIINDCPVLFNCYSDDDLRDDIKKALSPFYSTLAPHIDGNKLPLADAASVGLSNLNTYIDKPKQMKVGANVLIVFNNRNIDNFENGKFTKSTERMHSINDAVVVGVIKR